MVTTRSSDLGGVPADTAKIPRPLRIVAPAHVRRVRSSPIFRPFRPVTFAAATSGIPLKVAARVRIPLGVLTAIPLEGWALRPGFQGFQHFLLGRRVASGGVASCMKPASIGQFVPTLCPPRARLERPCASGLKVHRVIFRLAARPLIRVQNPPAAGGLRCCGRGA